MRQYEANDIRNGEDAGHGSSGRKSMIEAVLNRTGATRR